MEMQQKAELGRLASEKDEMKREMNRKLENALKRGCSPLACDACNTKVVYLRSSAGLQRAKSETILQKMLSNT